MASTVAPGRIPDYNAAVSTPTKNTLTAMFIRTAEENADRPAIKFRRGDAFQPVTFGELRRRVTALATAIAARGVPAGATVGLISDNRPEWLLCDLACLMSGVADVPRGSDSTVPEIRFILDHSGASACFVEDAAQLAKVLAMEEILPRLRFLAVMDPAFGGHPHPAVVPLAQLEREGEALLAAGDDTAARRAEAVGPDDTATIIYTSGTTGEPKGVVLRHRNIMHNVRECPPTIDINRNDRFLNILPPWHIFERMVEYLTLAKGASIAYTSLKTFAQDMQLERPTMVPSVPRVWEGIHDKVIASVASGPAARRAIFQAALRVRMAYVDACRVLTREDPLYVRPPLAVSAVRYAWAAIRAAVLWPAAALAYRIFAPVRARTGGSLRAAISGGGALPPHVDRFFSAVGLTIIEGYGLTETSPVVALRRFDRRVAGTVGPLVPGVEVKITDESGLPLGPGQKGTVKVRGELVMAGYHRRDDLTARVIDADGWFDTGDLGMMTIRGELAIRGRVKETIVLLGGENVEPSPIEQKLLESPYIMQVMVVGQDRKALGALVVPNVESIADRFRSEGRPAPADPAADQGVRDLIRAELQHLITPHTGFRPFERISRVALLSEPFRVGDELTHTLKMKRQVIAEKHAALIDSLFT
jgi:long-chain acyl-CoA synthetase